MVYVNERCAKIRCEAKKFLKHVFFFAVVEKKYYTCYITYEKE
jgi:hypothetical protein